MFGFILVSDQRVLLLQVRSADGSDLRVREHAPETEEQPRSKGKVRGKLGPPDSFTPKQSFTDLPQLFLNGKNIFKRHSVNFSDT